MSGKAERPNIVFIMSDEHDPRVTGCYGDKLVRTPNLDRLAGNSYVFDRAYCNSPICVPSRMSFLTGQYAHRNGIWDNGSVLPEDAQTIGHAMSKAGYETTLCGRVHIAGPDRLRGFDHRLVDDQDSWIKNKNAPDRSASARRGSNSHVSECGPGYGSHQEYDANVADQAVRFLQQKAAEADDQPWMLYVGFMFPHFPLIAPPEYYAMYDPESMPLPDLQGETLETQHPAIRQLRYFFQNDKELPESLTRQALASYYALVTLTDHHVGMILDAVDQSSLKENTVVIYVSDHGEMAGKHGIWQKECFYESSVRVPMMIRMPGDKGGKRIESNVSLVDMMPTIMDIAGLPEHNGLDGKSVMSLIRGEESGQDRVIISEYHAQGMLDAGFMALKGDWKYNYYVGERPQLFNIKQDPGEFDDLASNPSLASVAEELERELFKRVNPEEINRKAKEDQALRREKRKKQQQNG